MATINCYAVYQAEWNSKLGSSSSQSTPATSPKPPKSKSPVIKQDRNLIVHMVTQLDALVTDNKKLCEEVGQLRKSVDKLKATIKEKYISKLSELSYEGMKHVVDTIQAAMPNEHFCNPPHN